MQTNRLMICLFALAVAGCEKSNSTSSNPATSPPKDLISIGISNPPASGVTNAAAIESEASAMIQLGHTIQAAELAPTHTSGDGECFPATVDGIECYQLVRKEKRPGAYLYLKIAGHLKDPPFTNALIIVEYMDRVPHKPTAALTIEYDAIAGPYTRLNESVPLTGSNTWKQASFTLRDPLFKGRQNHGADFRLCVLAPDLHVRSVTVLKNAIEVPAE